MRSPGAPLWTATFAALLLLGLWWLGPRPVRELWHFQPLAAGDPLSRSISATPLFRPAWPETDGSAEQLLPAGVAERAVFFDADNDGDIDVVARASPAEGGDGPLVFFLRGLTGYREISATVGEPFTLDLPPGPLRVGDFDDDGRPDLAIARRGGAGPVVLWNGFQPRAWVGLELVPVGGQPRADVVRVGLPVGGRLRWHQVTLPDGGRGRCVAHVGLGDIPPDEGAVLQATIVWPGTAAVPVAVPVGAVTRMVEGQAGAPGEDPPDPAAAGAPSPLGDR